MHRIPNWLSGFRIAMVPVLAWLAWTGRAEAFLVALCASLASDVADGAAMWRSAELDPNATLAFVATLFKNADGSFEKKEYSVKAQACLHTPGAKTAKLATFAKTVVDLAQYATLEPPPEGTFTYLPLDAGASKAKGVIAGINVNVRWRSSRSDPPVSSTATSTRVPARARPPRTTNTSAASST